MVLVGVILVPVAIARAQIGKGNLILLNRGLQLQGMVTPDDTFHLSTYTNAGYTAISWLWTSNPSLMGNAPGFAWSRWVSGTTNNPPQGGESAYMSQLATLQLGDEWNLNDDPTRTQLVNWFNSASNSYPNTILYHNNYGGQVSDAALGDFISRAHPDLINFDLYPYHSTYDTNQPNHTGPPLGGTPISWYGELRRYRAWGLSAQIPFGIYRQTFHAVEDYDSQVYRDPSPSELRLNTFAALAFNAKMLIDFTYNTGASSLFTGGGDNNTNALYGELADVNHRAVNFGKALVRLTPLYELHNQNTTGPGLASSDACGCFPTGDVTSMMFFKGRVLNGAATNFTPLPNSFIDDTSTATNPASATSLAYSWWEFGKNDPYLSGWAVTNPGTKNNGLPGEVIISWFHPLDESFDGPNYSNEVYLMVVNGLTATNGTAADCAQQIKLNFINNFSDVVMLDPVAGVLQTNTLPVVSTRRQLVLNLNGGDAALFKFSDGAPFVGYAPPQAAQLKVATQGLSRSITLQGTVGSHYQVQSITSLTSTNWTTLTNIFLPISPYTYTNSAGAGNTFYRAIASP